MVKEERRHFIRHKKCSKFPVLLNGRSFDAEIIDYSVNGIGIIVHGSPSVYKGTVFDLNIPEPIIQTKGEIIWSNRSNSYIRIGIRRLGTLTGSLRDYRLADIFIGLQTNRRTGVLEVKSGSILKKVYVKDGDMIFSSSNQNDDRLGDILLIEKKINLEQYNHSVDVLKKTGKRQGTILVELGYLKPQELVWAVRHQVEEIILSLFSCEDGSFEFKDGPLPIDEVIILKLSAANLIYRGIKRINERRIRELLYLPIDAFLSFSSDPLDLFQSITLDSAGKEILSYISGKTSLKDILLLSRLDASETLKTIYALLSTRIIEAVDINKKEEGITEVSAEEVVKETEIEVPQEVIDRIEDIYNRHGSLGYYGILDIKERATQDEIKKAYYKIAKEFHPDRHFYLNSDDLKAKLNAIFSFVTQAYTTLSNPEKRKEYDRRLSLKPAQKISNEDLAQERFEEGKIEFAKYNIAQALELFGQAAYLNSSMAKYHYYYGFALNKLGRLKEAARAIQRALKIEPSNADYLAEAGHIYFKVDLPGRAKSAFEAALKISPSHKRATEGMANLSEETFGHER